VLFSPHLFLCFSSLSRKSDKFCVCGLVNKRIINKIDSRTSRISFHCALFCESYFFRLGFNPLTETCILSLPSACSLHTFPSATPFRLHVSLFPLGSASHHSPRSNLRVSIPGAIRTSSRPSSASLKAVNALYRLHLYLQAFTHI